MTLKELQGMIKEEFDALQNEAEDVDVSVSDADVDATEGDDSMEMLKKIYDMLKPKFEDMEGDDMDEEMMDEEMDEEMMDEVKDDERKMKQLIWKKQLQLDLETQELKILQVKMQVTHQLKLLQVMENYTKVLKDSKS